MIGRHLLFAICMAVILGVYVAGVEFGGTGFVFGVAAGAALVGLIVRLDYGFWVAGRKSAKADLIKRMTKDARWRNLPD